MAYKVGICEWMLPRRGIGCLQLTKDAGLDGVQLTFESVDGVFLLDDVWFRDYYLREAARLNLEMPSICVNEFALVGQRLSMAADPDGDEGKAVRAVIDRVIDAARYMRLQMVMLPSMLRGLIKDERDMENTAGALQYACRAAADDGISITSENLLNPEQCTELAQRVDSPNFAVLYDSQNYLRNCGWDPVEMLFELHGRGLLYPELHVKDSVEKYANGRFLGEGDTRFSEAITAIRDLHIDGWLHLESHYDCMPLFRAGETCCEILKTEKARLESYLS